jgi:hypothetical protein
MIMRNYYIISGGTFVDVAPHFALAAPAFGSVGRQLVRYLEVALANRKHTDTRVQLVLTRMAIGGEPRPQDQEILLQRAKLDDLVSNADLAQLLDYLTLQEDTACIVLPAAVTDFEPSRLTAEYGASESVRFGKTEHRRLSSSRAHTLQLKPSEKLVKRVRATRKDIFLVAFKSGDSGDAATLYAQGLAMLKKNSANLVLANDLRTHLNMVITPEQARYYETTDRGFVLAGLADMIALRSKLHFTRATVVPGQPVSWSSNEIPANLVQVVNHCIARGAYKPFLGATVGHFAARGRDGSILTSRRKVDFNKLGELGLVRIETDGPDRVIAHGFKPSVGGQSQRIIFSQYPDADCIVHFHCPLRENSTVPVRSQREYECGSHECGQNTSSGLKQFGPVLAVMLDKHGPNIVFNRSTDPAQVIDFIERNFDLSGRTDGEINLAAIQ